MLLWAWLRSLLLLCKPAASAHHARLQIHSLFCNQEWAAERLARLEADRGSAAEESRFSLNFLWLDKNIGVAVDQVFAKVDGWMFSVRAGHWMLELGRQQHIASFGVGWPLASKR